MATYDATCDADAERGTLVVLPGGLRPTQECRWCALLAPERRLSQRHTHHAPVTIRALPGATFRTTKWEVPADATQAGRHARPTWTPPADVGRAFAKACAKARGMLARLPSGVTFETLDAMAAEVAA